MFDSLFKKKTGNVHAIIAPIRQRPAQNENIVINVVTYVVSDPRFRVCNIASYLGISKIINLYR